MLTRRQCKKKHWKMHFRLMNNILNVCHYFCSARTHVWQLFFSLQQFTYLHYLFPWKQFLFDRYFFRRLLLCIIFRKISIDTQPNSRPGRIVLEIAVIWIWKFNGKFIHHAPKRRPKIELLHEFQSFHFFFRMHFN